MNKRGRIRVLVVGCGHMGSSHAKAYSQLPGFQICGLVARGRKQPESLNHALGKNYPIFADFSAALEESRPDAVCIATYPDTHARFARAAMRAGCHVFLEKPMATSSAEAEELIEISRRTGRKLVIGYILQHHPTWIRFVREVRKLGSPLVMRMNLNQQSSGETWSTHRNILRSMSPIVDCGVHYVDVMCRMVQARPVQVYAQGARLAAGLDDGTYNYGHLQILFQDGSVGWYEAGWGPMMSQTAFFIKDVVGPEGSVSIVDRDVMAGRSDDVDSHTSAASLLLHRSKLNKKGQFAQSDKVLRFPDDPGHDGLCLLEQKFFQTAIRNDLKLRDHLTAALNSLRIVLAADESVRKGKVIRLRG